MRLLTMLLALAVGLLSTGEAAAAIFVLEDSNSQVQIDSGSQSGMFDWFVDGTDQLAKQWFWFRIGDSGPEQSIDTLSLVSSMLTNGNTDPRPERLNLMYADPRQQFDIVVDFILTGGSSGSGVSDVAEVIRIRNRSTTFQDFRFFQYVDLDLGGTANGDTVELVNANAVMQTEGAATVSETVIAPRATRYETGLFPNTLNSLNNGTPTTLGNTAGPFTGDATWAFQWDFRLAPGGSFLISKDKHIVVPEPATATLAAAALALAGLIVARRRLR